MTTQAPDAVREAVAKAMYDATHAGLSNCYAWEDHWEDHQEHHRSRYYKEAQAAIDCLAALDSRAGDAFDMPEYAPDDISHLEGLASYLDGVARDKGRAGLPASKSLFEEIAKRLREYDVIRNRGRAGDAGEGCNGGRCPDCDDTGDVHRIDGEWLGTCHCPAGTFSNPSTFGKPTFGVAAAPAPAVDAQEVGHPCDTCQGNGEVVTDWDRYMHGKPGDTGDEGTKDCPDCDGTGRIEDAPAVDAVPAGEDGFRVAVEIVNAAADRLAKQFPMGSGAESALRAASLDISSAALSHGEARK